MAKKQKKQVKEETTSMEEENILLNFGVMIFNLMALNVLWFICSLPIVTMGAATTAVNYTCIKLQKDEGDSLVRMYFKSFIQNIRQAAILNTGMLTILIIQLAGLIQLAGGAANGNLLSTFLMVLVILTVFFWLLLYSFMFFVLARFDNSLLRTVTNSLYLMYHNRRATIRIFFTIFFMFIIIPIGLWYFFPYGFPMLIFIGLPLTAYLEAKYFNFIFDKYIPESK